MSQSSTTVTALLEAASSGDEQALDALFALVYDELRRLAHVVRQDRTPVTLSTTALVHEAYLKLAGSNRIEMHNRLHFFRVAARAMRQVLVDAAQKRSAAKRGGGQVAATFNEEIHAGIVTPEKILALDEALRHLEAFDPRQGQIVECRFFAGLTIDETAEAMSLSAATVNREWRLARAWLARILAEP